ncbi:lipocalin-like domain-containing protein [Gluconacetobacter sp. 1b LMG 1731]|uniref:Lipocalin-like domain-containing protein n=1 Tax=Gluconacetobacter dulcium TaxID=2729096 RepID=A0A7W4IN15_9PROT|nr:lipocalin-like domain-containing protein [Gluconacetobacter dulcium]MBB2194916.1 lipocalin-like domain-containing protein [Gluconacetobacter dulcium]MBB2199207.1 lipocalin-like domain-containing protein [Gluconacetobacter dulcium]
MPKVTQLKHAHSNDLAQQLIGTWKLVSYQVEDKKTGEMIEAMGETPRGRVVFTADGWVAFNLEGSDRQPAETDWDRAQLMKTLVAYIGRYRIEQDQWITDVETAWAPEWVGTEQRRTVSVEGSYATVVTPWREMPNWADRGASRSLIRFERA